MAASLNSALGPPMPSGLSEIVIPYRPIPLAVPEGMKPNEFFNSAENLAAFMQERYPDHETHLLNAGEESLDVTWPLTISCPLIFS